MSVPEPEVSEVLRRLMERCGAPPLVMPKSILMMPIRVRGETVVTGYMELLRLLNILLYLAGITMLFSVKILRLPALAVIGFALYLTAMRAMGRVQHGAVNPVKHVFYRVIFRFTRKVRTVEVAKPEKHVIYASARPGELVEFLAPLSGEVPPGTRLRILVGDVEAGETVARGRSALVSYIYAGVPEHKVRLVEPESGTVVGEYTVVVTAPEEEEEAEVLIE